MKHIFLLLLAIFTISTAWSQINNQCDEAEGLGATNNTIPGQSWRWYRYIMPATTNGFVKFTSSDDSKIDYNFRYGYDCQYPDKVSAHVLDFAPSPYLGAGDTLFVMVYNRGESSEGVFANIIGSNCQTAQYTPINGNNFNIDWGYFLPKFHTRTVTPIIDSKITVKFRTIEEVRNFDVVNYCNGLESAKFFDQVSPTEWRSRDNIPANTELGIVFEPIQNEYFQWAVIAGDGYRDRPIPIEELGAQQFPSNNDYSEVYYVYQAEAGELITASSPHTKPGQCSIYPKLDIIANEWYVGDRFSSYYAETDQEVIIHWDFRDYIDTGFSWTLSSRSGELGDNCDNPIQILNDENTVAGIDKKRYYYEYTMPSSGRVRIESETPHFVNILDEACDKHVPYEFEVLTDGEGGFIIDNEKLDTENSLKIEGAIQQNDNLTPIDVTNSDKASVGQLLEAGYQTGDVVRFYWEPTGLFSFASSFDWTIAVESSDLGDDCWNAITPNIGSNSLVSKEINDSYWYTYTATGQGKAHFVAPPNAKISVYKNQACDSLVNQEQSGISEFGIPTILPTVIMELGDVIHFNLETRNPTGASIEGETFEFGFEPLEMGDTPDMPILANEGVNNLGETVSNRLWYSFTMPDNGEVDQILEITAGSFRNNISFYQYVDGELILLKENKGSTQLKTVSAGDEILIVLDANEQYEWTLTVRSRIIGDDCEQPIVIQEGMHVMEYAPYWYSFTPSETGLYRVFYFGFSEDEGTVDIFTDCDQTLHPDVIYESEKRRFLADLEANQTYLIRWNAQEDISWFLNREYYFQYIEFDSDTIPQLVVDVPFTPMATAESGLEVSFEVIEGEELVEIDGDIITPVAVGTVALRAHQSGNTYYSEAYSQSRTYEIVPGNQSISFDAIEDQLNDAQPFEVSPASSVGLPLTLSISGPATLIGQTVTLSGEPGEVIINATNNGNENYFPAAASVDFIVLDANLDQVITIEAIEDKLISSEAFNVVATSTSGLAVTLSLDGPATLDVHTITLDGIPGTVTIIANQDGNEFYNAAPEVSISFEVTTPAKEDQSISFNSIEDQFLEVGTIILSATASSGLDVSYTATDKAAVEGNVLTLLDIGEVTITASQDGNDSFMAAESVSQTFNVISITATNTTTPPKKIKVYPNPASDFLTIISDDKIESIYLIDISGVVLKTFDNYTGQSIDVSDLKAGIYILKVEVESDRVIKRLYKH